MKKQLSERGIFIDMRCSGDLNAYYCRGVLSVAFVLSAPGKEEEVACMPVAGATGHNMEKALQLMKRLRPDWFPEQSRYSYRITNASSEPEYRQKSNRSEAGFREVKSQLDRVARDLSGCRLVVLCGKRAQSLGGDLKVMMEGTHMIGVCHPGARGLSATYRGEEIRKLATPGERSEARIRKWAEEICRGLPARQASVSPR